MKTQRRKDGETQNEELNFAPSRLGDSALNASTSAPARKRRKTLAQGNSLSSVSEDAPSPEREEATDLPEGWEGIPLGDCLVLIRNGITANQNKEGRGHPVTRIETIAQDRINPRKFGYVEELTEEQVERYALQAGDILFSHINSEPQLGRTAIFQETDGVLLHGMNLLMMRANQRVDPWFLHYKCQSLRQRGVFIGLAARAVGQSSINQGKLKALPLAVPPLPEQRAIAGVLRTVREAKEACERVVVATRQLKQSFLHYLFTYGPVPFGQAAHVPLKKTEIGPMPQHWGTIHLGDTASIGNGSTPKRTEPRYWDGGAIPWLTSAKVHDRTIRQADEFVTQTAREECHLPLVSRGSLVIAITGQGKTLGNAAKLELAACVSQHLAYLTFHDTRLLPEFVLAFLRLRYDELQTISRGGGSTKGALTCGFLKRFEVPLPPLPEQRDIAAQLAAVDAKLAAEESRRAALATLFQSLLHHLMTGKVRLPSDSFSELHV
jgi:type I restriction enzyme, S subunit